VISLGTDNRFAKSPQDLNLAEAWGAGCELQLI